MDVTTIVTNGDLTIEVTEFNHQTLDTDKNPTVKETHQFLVSREVLVESSRYFKILLYSKDFKEAGKDKVELKDDSITAMKALLQVLHKVEPDHNVPLETMWDIAAAGKKYDLEMLCLSGWFGTWYHLHAKEHSDSRYLLYPCWLFDHHKGFMSATRSCAYNFSGHVHEMNPTRHKDIHLPPRIIQQLNAARGRLRTVIHRELYRPNDKLLQAFCPCRKETLYDYEKALTDIQVWPLEKVAQHTAIQTIIKRLHAFIYAAKSTGCRTCRMDFSNMVSSAGSLTHRYFDGLCLDCMDRSKSKDEDGDYWIHQDFNEMDHIKCVRGLHIQSTWYFSYMGRRQRRDRMRRDKHMARADSDSE
ncbi:MAG: hypothetical protein Q9220_007308 [cf. Caloplaca sp. 1 TL-2023]